MTKAEEKKLEAAAERLIKKMRTEEPHIYIQEGYIYAYNKYMENHSILIGTLLCIPERMYFSDKIISEYNRRDLKEFVKFLLKIRQEKDIELIHYRKEKEK